jgi:uncharacterized protein YutE (UPF0331/DUF86 family)
MKKKKSETPIYDETTQRLAALTLTSERVGRLKHVLELRNWAVYELNQTDNPEVTNLLKALLTKLDNA